MDKARELMGRLSDSFMITQGGSCVIRDNPPEWVDDLVVNLDCDWKIIEKLAAGLRCQPSALWLRRSAGICYGLIDVRNTDLLDWVRDDLSREVYIVRALECGIPGENDFFHMIQSGQYVYFRGILEEIIRTIGGIAEEARPFAAGWNMPGYLPDVEPCTFESFEDAREFIIGELQDYYSSSGYECTQGTSNSPLAAVKGALEPFCIPVGSYEYWVSLRPNWLEYPTGEE